MNRRKLVALAAAMVMLTSLFAGGCGKDSDSTADEYITSASDTSASEAAAPVNQKTSAPTSAETQAQEITEAQREQADADAQSNNPDGDENSGYCTVITEDESCSLSVGDTFTYVFNLKTPDLLEDFQATTNYDSGMLELVDADTAEMFPVAGKIVVCNTELVNCVKFNAVNLEGMDFTKGGQLLAFKFRVLDSGSTAVGTTLEYMDSVKSEPYVSDYRIVGDIEYSEEIIK